MKALTFLFLLHSSLLPAQTIGLLQNSAAALEDGYILFSPIGSVETYLIDKCGHLVKDWSSTYRPGQAVYLTPNGELLRTGNANNSTFNAGGKGGVIELMDWNNNLLWSYTISSTTVCQHHDIALLPNGNVLALVWESKTNAEALAAGRNPALTASTVWSEKIIEIQPIGATGGQVVWEWHLWDHLIQDYDATQANYGTIANHPELVDVNYNASANTEDWIHLNSIDYNAALDQIVVSSHSFNELWIIDHSTTTAEASTATGGNSGQGGSLLYRWGNPAAYQQGAVAQQHFFGQHDAYWIPASYPYGGQLMVYNNGLNRTGGNYTTCEIISTPNIGYSYNNNTLPYGPAQPSWIYNAGNTANYYAQNISGAQQLPNGNVLLCNGPDGEFREVDSSGTVVWQYINPVSGQGILTQNTLPNRNLVFRCQHYPSSFAGFSGRNLVAGSTIENSNTVSDACHLSSYVASIQPHQDLKIYPNPAQEFIQVELPSSASTEGTVYVYNQLGKVVKVLPAALNLSINLQNLPRGVYHVQVLEAQQQWWGTFVIQP